MSMLRKVSVASLLAVAVFAGAMPSQADEKELKFGTLAPKRSLWGKVFQAWQDAVSEQTKGAVKLTFFWGATKGGDEEGMVKLMKDGSQLDGAAMTSVGLSKIAKMALALQMPGLFKSWGALDKARDSMKDDLNKAFSDEGYTILGYGDVGIARVMSKDFAVKLPDDLKGKKPYYLRGDSIAPTLFSVIGGVTGVPASVPEVLPGLNSGSINVVNAPSLAASQLQWSSKLTHINTAPSGFAIGALVIRKASLDGLAEDQKKVVLDTGSTAATALTRKVRGADEDAFKKAKEKMEKVEPSDDDISKWKSVFRETRAKLKGGNGFDAALVEKLEGMSDNK